MDETLAYVFSLSGREADSTKAAAGKEKYDTLCVACHGADGAGNPALGAPSLADDVWLYGGSDADVRHSVAVGREGRMPAHGEFLGEARVHVLAAWVWSLSNRGAHGATHRCSVRVHGVPLPAIAGTGSAGMTAMDDQRTRTAPNFSARQRGQVP